MPIKGGVIGDTMLQNQAHIERGDRIGFTGTGTGLN